MNANAGSWAPSAGAASWTPTPPPPAAAAAAADDDVDESDPLWLATLEIAEGDRDKAKRMLEDPDALMANPTIAAIIAGAEDRAAENDDSDSDAGVDVGALKVADAAAAAAAPPPPPAAAAAPAPAPAAAPAAPTPKPSTSSTSARSAKAEAAAAAALALEAAEADHREHLNLVFIGHVDAGKSTLCGQILYITNHVDQRTIEKYEREAKQRNRESWFLAFIMDTNEEERAKGKTVEVGRAHIATDAKRYTILDAPGHKNYVPNMIAGASQADVGVLVISARKGEFEAGFDRQGQTREHAMLAKTLGVKYLVVVVNKMDDPTVQWSQERFEECVSKLKPYLKAVGYMPRKECYFVPISAITGENILKEVSSDRCDWWADYVAKGEHNTKHPTLLSVMDNLNMSSRDAEGPLRLPILDRYTERGTVVLGKVESGTIRIGQQIVIMPTNMKSKVDEILVNEVSVSSARPGENVCVKLLNVGVEDTLKGFIICDEKRPCKAVTRFIAEFRFVEALEHRPLFTNGYECVLHMHTLESEVTCMGLVSVTEPRKKGQSEAVVNKRPRFAKVGALVRAKFQVPMSLCAEAFEDFEHLGRFTLRDEGRTIAIGKILKLA